MNQNLPEQFIARVSGQLGNEMPAFLHEYEFPYLRGIRFNPMKKACSDKVQGVGESVPWADNAYYLDHDSSAGTTVWHEAGAFYIQEPSAMIPAAVMNAKPGEMILDLCAAPGGKSTQMACDMKGEGLIVCNEPVPKRAAILSRNVERMGIPNTIVTSAWPDQLAEKWPGLFSGVMVDAPCSGEGMFRRNPDSIQEWTPENAAGCAERQKTILNAAAKLVCPGGRIVFSTCTMNPEENERNVEWFLNGHPDFEKQAFVLNGLDGSSGMFTCWPHRVKGEGQFVALLRRKGSILERTDINVLPPADIETVNRIREIGFENIRDIRRFGNMAVSLSVVPDIRHVKVMRVGLHLCEIREKQFIPDHAAAVSFLKSGLKDYPINGSDALRYMRGETFPADGKGWVAVSLEGLVLGWGKISDGILKNHYPKGLRNSQLTI